MGETGCWGLSGAAWLLSRVVSVTWLYSWTLAVERSRGEIVKIVTEHWFQKWNRVAMPV